MCEVFREPVCENNHSDGRSAIRLRCLTMKGKRRRSRNRSGNHKMPRAAQVVGFSAEEEAFFRAGESAENLEAAYESEPASWLRRLFATGS